MLNETDIEQFATHGFIEIKNFIDKGDCDELRKTLNVLQANGHLKMAAIGKQTTERIDNAERGDYISWIDNELAEGSVKKYLIRMEELRQLLNRNFFLGLNYFECHFALYPAQTFYKKHQDTHKNGSTRKVSTVLYLNENWKEMDGGQLVLFHENSQTTQIQPAASTLVVFLSEKEHEVLITKTSRSSITGWFHQKIF